MPLHLTETLELILHRNFFYIALKIQDEFIKLRLCLFSCLFNEGKEMIPNSVLKKAFIFQGLRFFSVDNTSEFIYQN